MPIPPSISQAIRDVRRELGASPQNDRKANQTGLAVARLIQNGKQIVADAETLGEVLALSPELEAYRGKGSQVTTREFAFGLLALTDRTKERLPQSANNPGFFPREEELGDDAGDVPECLHMLSAYFFERVHGPRVRSRHAAGLRALAWQGLEAISEVCRRPEHLARALEVAADPRAADGEREAAVQFLVTYWGGDDPDEATVKLLRKLESAPASRRMLVGVMQAQIDLGLNDEFGAMVTVEDWDDAHEGKG